MTNGKDRDRDWSDRQRVLWWLKIAVLVIPLSSAIAAAFVWGYTRASVGYVDDRDAMVMAEVDKKESKDHASEVEQRTTEELKETKKALGRVDRNLVRFLTARGMKNQIERPPDED